MSKVSKNPKLATWSSTYSTDINAVHDCIVLAARKHVDGPILVLGLVMCKDVRDGLGVGRNGEVADEELFVFVLLLLKMALDCVQSSLDLSLLPLLLLVYNPLLDLGELRP